MGHQRQCLSTFQGDWDHHVQIWDTSGPAWEEAGGGREERTDFQPEEQAWQRQVARGAAWEKQGKGTSEGGRERAAAQELGPALQPISTLLRVGHYGFHKFRKCGTQANVTIWAQ